MYPKVLQGGARPEESLGMKNPFRFFVFENARRNPTRKNWPFECLVLMWAFYSTQHTHPRTTCEGYVIKQFAFQTNCTKCYTKISSKVAQSHASPTYVHINRQCYSAKTVIPILENNAKLREAQFRSAFLVIFIQNSRRHQTLSLIKALLVSDEAERLVIIIIIVQR